MAIAEQASALGKLGAPGPWEAGQEEPTRQSDGLACNLNQVRLLCCCGLQSSALINFR